MWAIEVRDQLRELIWANDHINRTGESGHYGRDLVTITLSDGRDAGKVLMSEGLAQCWPNDGDAI